MSADSKQVVWVGKRYVPGLLPNTKVAGAIMNDWNARLYRCPVCDTVVEVLDKVGMDLVCCGPPMVPLKPNKDTDGHGHHPTIRSGRQTLTIAVGEGDHPMEEDHHIEWIEVTYEGKCFRQFLRPGETPQATFEIDACSREVSLQAYCNVHGLWQSVAELKVSPSGDYYNDAARSRGLTLWEALDACGAGPGLLSAS